MAKEDMTRPKLTRGDKMHKKFMDKLDSFKDVVTHSLDSFTITHKQTLEASLAYDEYVSKSQEAERAVLYDIIKNSEDETKCKEAYARLTELDRDKNEQIKNHNELIQTERDKTNKNIAGSLLCFAVASKLISNKQVRQLTGKAISSMKKSLPKIQG